MKFTKEGRARYQEQVEEDMRNQLRKDPEFLSHLLLESRTGLNDFDDNELIAEGVMRGVGEPTLDMIEGAAPFHLPVSIEDEMVFGADTAKVCGLRGASEPAKDYIVKAINGYSVLKAFFDATQAVDLAATHTLRDQIKEMKL